MVVGDREEYLFCFVSTPEKCQVEIRYLQGGIMAGEVTLIRKEYCFLYLQSDCFFVVVVEVVSVVLR